MREKDVKSKAVATEQASGEKASLTRDELKHIKRKQAEERNALYKRMQPLQKKYTTAETELEALMLEQDSIEQSLADPDIYADTAQATPLLQRFGEVKARVEELMEQMAELEEELAVFEEQRKMLLGEDA